MGSNNSKPTVGFSYFLGLHLVLAQNKLRILGLKFGEKIGWEGSLGGGDSISVDKKELFGGSDAEGGVSGSIDVLDGSATQGVNSYLSSVLGSTISAYRGVTSLVFKQFYFGNNPYLKPLSIKAMDVSIGEEWNPSEAYLNIETSVTGAEVYITVDLSGSMAGARFTYTKTAVKNYLEALKGTVNSVAIVGWNLNVRVNTSITDCSDDDYDTLKAFVDAFPSPDSGTSFNAALSLASDFFTTTVTDSFIGEGLLSTQGNTGLSTAPDKARIVLLLTDGIPSYPLTDMPLAIATAEALTDVDIYCINIDAPDTQYTAQLDNTPLDGVPVVDSSETNALIDTLSLPFTKWSDMNVAHILRDVLVSESSGGSGTTALIGDSFATAATTFASEDFGLSFNWRKPSSRDEFINDVQKHADCVIFEDRSTGKWEIKLIRNDYSVGSLDTFDVSNVVKWHDNIALPRQNDLPNQITVVYTKRSDGSTSSITAMNIAAVQQIGRIIPEKVTYKGITHDDLAAKVVMRDLAAKTVPLLVGTITVTSASLDLTLGSAFIIDNPQLGIDAVVVRLTGREETGGSKPQVILDFIEDKFSLPDAAIVSPDVVVEDDTNPLNCPISLVGETPYYSLVTSAGQIQVDDSLAVDPDYGIVTLGGTKPNSQHTMLDIATNPGPGWTLIGSVGFTPTAPLKEFITSANVTSFTLNNNDGLRQVSAGSLCLIDEEIMRVDDMVLAGGVVTVTVGRGCLDTTPKKHSLGTPVLFYDGFTLSDDTQYVAGETVEGKLLSRTIDGRLSLSDATTSSVTLDSRAIRPYPVGKLEIEGDLAYEGVIPEVSDVTWAHRDRLTQVGTSVEDVTYASIGPEAGVEYTLRVRAVLGKTTSWFDDSDVFAQTCFFLNEGSGTLIREYTKNQFTSHSHPFEGVLDFFYADDVFTATDIFAAVNYNFFSTTDLFSSEDLPDFFTYVAGRAMQTQIEVAVTRDGYQNWQVASTVGKHFMTAYNIQGERF